MLAKVSNVAGSGMSQSSRRRRNVVIWILVLIALWGVWCAFFLDKGFEFQDEGMYCSDAWRLSHGDALFRDTMPGLGLSPWFLSLVFRVYPACSLLGLRIVWAIVMLLYALLTAKLMSKYFNLVVSCLAASASLFFIGGGLDLNVRVLSYATMPVLGLLVTTYFWLAALRAHGKRQILFAGSAGAAAFLATACRISLLLIVFLPLFTLLYDRCCRVKTEGGLRVTLAFFAAYAAGLACFFIALVFGGEFNDFFKGLAQGTEVSGHSLKDMVVYAGFNCGYLLGGALPVLLLVLIFSFKRIVSFLSTHKRSVGFTIFIICLFCLLLAVMKKSYYSYVVGEVELALRHHWSWSGLTSSWAGLWLGNGLAMGVVFVAIVAHGFDSSNNKGSTWAHDRYRLGLIAILLALIMMAGSNVVPNYAIKCISWLTISAALGLIWVWVAEHTKNSSRVGLVWVMKGALVGLLLLYTFYGVVPGVFGGSIFGGVFGDAPIKELVARPTTDKMNSIMTTYDRARTLDQLVNAVRTYSEPKDRILAYEDIPILYYLADRLPSPKFTWVGEQLSMSTRESILEDMLSRDRTPSVVIRSIDSNVVRYIVGNWSENERETDPIDRYIRDHYRVVDEISGFEVMVPAK